MTLSAVSSPGSFPVAGRVSSPTTGPRSLAAALRSALRGEVRFDTGSRALYATDSSNYRQVPIGVVIPCDVDDVVAAVSTCHRFDVPVLARGGGTSLAGQCCNAAVVIDCSKHVNRLVELNVPQHFARVQPGLVLDTLRDAARPHDLTFGPDPATHNHCTLGGMLGNNSCGVHSVMAGRTSDNVEELEVLTYDGLRMRVGRTSDAELERIISSGGRRGEIYASLRALRDANAAEIRSRYPHIPRRVSGFNLDDLLPERGFNVARALVGSEGTCVTILEATLNLIAWPRVQTLVALGYPDAYTTADHVPEIMATRPIGLEGFGAELVNDMKQTGFHPEDIKLLPEGGGWLLVQYGADTTEEADAKARSLMTRLRGKPGAPTMRHCSDPREASRIWTVRDAALGVTAIVPGQRRRWAGWEDAAVPPERLGDYLRAMHALLERYGYQAALYGHFGQGCIHCRIDFDLRTTDGIAHWRAFLEEAADIVVRFGGSLSGEHGDGQSRAELLPRMFGSQLVSAFETFKSIWDPAWRMNPGKVVRPHRVDDNLRLGTGYDPPSPLTHFAFPEDEGSFAATTLRCVGMGVCRRTEGGTMCPSFMATREERYSTRGRARLLFEMLSGELRHEGWRSPAVRDALDLCLACKGCKSDCPVHVDMATYKAEFLSHYYARRVRPPAAYAMGLIHWWARAASRAPRLVNHLASAPAMATLAKRGAGIALARQIPRFARQTFRSWWFARPSTGSGASRRGRVMLWPDTFNNFFTPQIAQAAVTVLEDAGFEVVVPRSVLCCGRPLYDWGMLRRAERLLHRILHEMRDEIAAGTPVVGLEPSCVSVFRDELVNLFPERNDARRLSGSTFLLGEFLDRVATDYSPGRLDRDAIIHQHCHHKSVLDSTAEQRVLDRTGVRSQVLDSGCCGMAGAFGFEASHYDVSMAIGERVLLPAVRAAHEDTLIVVDGFSCREQVEQATGRHTTHPAEVLAMAIAQRDGTRGVRGAAATPDR